jgi:hypothetical protein
LPITNHYSNLEIDTIDHGKPIDCTTHHICQEITTGDQDGVAVDGDDEYARGGWSLPEAIPVAFPPSELLRRQPYVSLFLCF